MDFTIDSVARLTGISAFTLRNWESRYGLPKPRRHTNGFRIYNEVDIVLLRQVAALVEQGARVSDLAKKLRAGEPLPEPMIQPLGEELASSVDDVFAAMLKFDTERVDRILSLLASRFSAARMVEIVYTPLLQRFGTDWAAEKISIAQEHFATALIRMRLAPMLCLYVPASANSRKVLCATTSGELHEGGLLLLAVQLKLRGWNVIYLGTNLPVDELSEVVKATAPDIACLSFGMTDAARRDLPSLAKLGIPICIGGSATSELGDGKKLPDQIHLFKVGGAEAIGLLEMIV